MVQALFGKKIEQTQKFLENGTRIPVTIVRVSGNVVVQHKTADKHGYTAVQVGFGTSKKTNKAKAGHLKKAGVTQTPSFLGEVSVDGEELPTLGSKLNAIDILKPGDIVDVIGTSKGKGYAGGVKRYHFKGGPRTHGQSDRERAPGSIGQTTTPGRVYRGKKMAGHMGHETVTVKNLIVVDVTADTVAVKGLIPGSISDKALVVKIEKVGEKKKFIPLLKTQDTKTEEKPVVEVPSEPDQTAATAA
jgi:large subunit ribosomal protein L3